MTLIERLEMYATHGVSDEVGLALRDAASALAALTAEVRAWRDHKPLNPVSLLDAPILRAKMNTDASAAGPMVREGE